MSNPKMKTLITLLLIISTNVQGQTKVKYCDTCEVIYLDKKGQFHFEKLDSSKFYWKKYNYFKNKMTAAVDQMNSVGYPAMDEKIFRLEDSCRKYKLLLDKIKK